MRLSACLIVKNEGARLARAVESVRGVADEVVITDTGSTDDTRELARSLGCRVFHHEWADDFAAARNACLAHARGEWVLWLDGDERLKPGSDKDVQSAITDPGVIAWQVIREDFFHEDRPDWFSEMMQMRLVRRSLPCRFVGRIHEHLVPAPVEIAPALRKSVRVSAIRLQHWGYTRERLPEKLARGAALCELELRERPGQLYYLVELARSYVSLNDPRAGAVLGKAAAMMLARRSDPAPPTPMASALIEQLLALPGQAFASEDDLLALAARWFPRSVPLLWAAARVRSARGEFPAAESLLRTLIGLLDRGDGDRYTSFDPRVGEDARFNLAVCLVRRAELKEARDLFTALLASPRRSDAARQNLAAISDVESKFGDGGSGETRNG